MEAFKIIGLAVVLGLAGYGVFAATRHTVPACYSEPLAHRAGHGFDI